MRYARWKPNPLREVQDPAATQPYTELARRFFRWVGPATLGEFQWFSGLGVKASKEAVAPLGLVPAEPGATGCCFPKTPTRSARSRRRPSRSTRW